MRNNPSTGNLAALISQAERCLQGVRSHEAPPAYVTAATNVVWLCRLFMKYLVDQLPARQVAAQLSATGSSATHTPAESIPPAFLSVLTRYVAEVEPTPVLHDLHLEILNLLIVLLSTQLLAPSLPDPSTSLAYDPSDPPQDLFLHHLMLAPHSPTGRAAGGTAGAQSATEAEGQAGSEEGAPSLAPSAAGPFVAALLRNFCARLKAPELTAEALRAAADTRRDQVGLPQTADKEGLEEPTGLLWSIADALVSVPVSLGSKVLSWLRGSTKVDAHPLAERSMALLLILAHNFRSHGASNPYHRALSTMFDASFGAEPLQSKAPGTTAIEVSFEKLHKSFAISSETPLGTALLYTLLHGNSMLMDYVLSRTDLDALVLPLMRQLYGVDKLRPNQRYILLIVLLLVTQDASFSETAHKRVILPTVPWFRERILTDMSLGSLMFVMLLRAIQFNLTKLQDAHLHRYAFAALVNLAPHCEQMHPYAAQRLVTVLDVLARKFVRLQRRTEAAAVSLSGGAGGGGGGASSGAATGDTVGVNIGGGGAELKDVDLTVSSSGMTAKELAETRAMLLEQYAEYLRIVLEILHACVAPRVLSHNLNLVYALLHKRSVLEPLGLNARFVDLVEGLREVLSHFAAALDQEFEKRDGAWAEEDVREVLQVACRSWRGGGGSSQSAADNLADLRFSYVEEASPEDFFVPYVWSLVVEQTPDLMWDPARTLLFPLSDAGLREDLAPLESAPIASDAGAAAMPSADAEAPPVGASGAAGGAPPATSDGGTGTARAGASGAAGPEESPAAAAAADA